MSALCDEIEKFGKGIGNATRYTIIESLLKGERTVSELVAITGLSQPLVSQHLKTLRGASLVSSVRRGQEVFYTVNNAYILDLLKKLTVDIKARPERSRRESHAVRPTSVSRKY